MIIACCFSLPTLAFYFYEGEYATPGCREDKDVDVQLLLFASFGGFGKGVGEILWKAVNGGPSTSSCPRLRTSTLQK